MRNLYAGMLVLVLCGATLLSLGGCQESLALLGDDIGEKSEALASGNGQMTIWSSEEKPLAAAPADRKAGDAEKLYTIEEISAMMEAEARNETVTAATRETVEDGIVIPEPEIQPLTAAGDAAAPAAETALPDLAAAGELPETEGTVLAQAQSGTDAIALPETVNAGNGLPEAPAVADMLDAIDAAAEEGALPKLPEVTALAETPAVTTPEFTESFQFLL